MIEHQVTERDGGQESPWVFENEIIFHDRQYTDVPTQNYQVELHHYDISGSTDTRLTNELSKKLMPVFNAEYILYLSNLGCSAVDQYNLTLMNRSTSEATVVAECGQGAETYSISEFYAAWVAIPLGGGNKDVFVRDLQAEYTFRIDSTVVGNQYFPHTDEERVVWQDSRDGRYGQDPNHGPIRTYRYAHQLVRLFPRSVHAAEARFRLLTEQKELRLARGGHLYPFYALHHRRDLEVFLGRHRRGPYALRARFELAALHFDLWLMSSPAFQRTSDYRDYRKVGGEPVSAAAGQRHRRRATQIYDACLKKPAALRATYRDPAANFAPALRRARRHRKLLRRSQPPAQMLPITFFPPG